MSDHTDDADVALVGQTRDVGFQVGARRRLPIAPGEAWALLLGPHGLPLWLGDLASGALAQGQPYALADGRGGEVRVLREGSHVRLTLGLPGASHRPSTVQLHLLPQGQRTTIALHEEHLAGPEERERRRQFYHAALDRIAALCEGEL